MVPFAGSSRLAGEYTAALGDHTTALSLRRTARPRVGPDAGISNWNNEVLQLGAVAREKHEKETLYIQAS